MITFSKDFIKSNVEYLPQNVIEDLKKKVLAYLKHVKDFQDPCPFYLSVLQLLLKMLKFSLYQDKQEELKEIMEYLIPILSHENCQMDDQDEFDDEDDQQITRMIFNAKLKLKKNTKLTA